MVLRRQNHSSEAGGSGPAAPGAFGKQYPSLWEYLTTVSWPDGTARRTSTLLLFSDAGCVKLCLNDRDAELSTWMTGRDPEEALEALEAVLEAGTGEWRANPTKRRK